MNYKYVRVFTDPDLVAMVKLVRLTPFSLPSLQFIPSPLLLQTSCPHLCIHPPAFTLCSFIPSLFFFFFLPLPFSHPSVPLLLLFLFSSNFFFFFFKAF